MRQNHRGGSQYFGGIFRRMPRFSNISVTAAGSAQTDGIAIPGGIGFVTVTGGNGTKGAILPAPDSTTEATVIFIKNDDAANAVAKIYPNSASAKINSGSAGAAISMAAKTFAMFVSFDGVNWETLPLLPS